MAELRRAVERAAAAPFAVLIEGESGSGKELVARAIHRGSARRDRAVLHAELRRAARRPRRGRAVRPRARRVHRRGRRARRRVRGGARRHAVPRRDRRAVAARAGQGAARDSGRRAAARRRERRRGGSTCASCRRPTATCGRRSRPAASGSICSIASTSSASPCRRCASGARTSRCSPSISGATRPRASAAARRSAPATIAALARYDWPGNVRELQNVLAALAVRSPSAASCRRRRCRPRFGERRDDECGARRGAAHLRGALRARRAGAHRRPSRPRGGGTRRHAQGLTKLMTRLGIAADESNVGSGSSLSGTMRLDEDALPA